MVLIVDRNESELIKGLIPQNAVRIEIISSGNVPKQRDFITHVLRKAGPRGLFVNQMYRAWCRLLEHYGRKTPSYSSFRKAIHNFHTAGVIERIPPSQTPDYDPLADPTFQRSYYRLPITNATPSHLAGGGVSQEIKPHTPARQNAPSRASSNPDKSSVRRNLRT